MKKLKVTSQFKKDLKRIKNKPQKIEHLEIILQILSSGNQLPAKYKPHYLAGSYNGYMECHIENDFLLIWADESNEIIKLIRLGSHSELFKM